MSTGQRRVMTAIELCRTAALGGQIEQCDQCGQQTHRVAISNNRLLDIEDGQVSFRYKDYKDRSQQKTMSLSAEEFIRRFLLHVLPRGFHRIRYFGFLGNRHRQEKLDPCRQLLGVAIPELASDQPAARITVIGMKH